MKLRNKSNKKKHEQFHKPGRRDWGRGPTAQLCAALLAPNCKERKKKSVPRSLYFDQNVK